MVDSQERKRGAPIWLWVAALLAVASVVWALLLARADRPEEVLPDEVATSTQLPDSMVTHAAPGAEGPVVAAGVLPAVAEFEAECTSLADVGAEMSVEHRYEADCIRLLSVALSSVIQRDTVARVALEPRLEAYRQQAAALESSPPDADGHTQRLRAVAISAAELMRLVWETRAAAAPGLGEEVVRTRRTAEAIRPQVPLLEQSGRTAAFFQQAGEALRLLAEREV